MKIIKRSGSEVTFDIQKIVNAITAANNDAAPHERLTEDQIALAAHSVEWLCARAGHTVSVEEIQDMVENQIMAACAVSRSRASTSSIVISKRLKRTSQHDRRQNPVAHRVQQRRSEAGEFEQEPHGEFRTARLHGRRGFQRHHYAACCCLPKSWLPTTKALSTSTMPTTSRSTCTIATS